MQQKENKFPKRLDHLNKTFLEELNYKMWVTKGARFNASKRLSLRDDWSNKAMGFLSAYLIIIGLLSVYQVSQTPIISPNIIAFSSTAISILVLAFSQMEAAQDYKMRAHRHIECSLKISKLYNDLRIFKTMSNPNDDEKAKYAVHLSNKYQDILDHYDNHNSVDFSLFQTKHSKYFELNKFKVFLNKARFYTSTLFLYHILIFSPLLIGLLVYINSK